jgi:hypothetical protein
LRVSDAHSNDACVVLHRTLFLLSTVVGQDMQQVQHALILTLSQFSFSFFCLSVSVCLSVFVCQQPFATLLQQQQLIIQQQSAIIQQLQQQNTQLQQHHTILTHLQQQQQQHSLSSSSSSSSSTQQQQQQQLQQQHTKTESERPLSPLFNLESPPPSSSTTVKQEQQQHSEPVHSFSSPCKQATYTASSSSSSSPNSLSSPSARKYYAVRRGRNTGIFRSWDDCRTQTDGFRLAVFKSFHTLHEAQQFMQEQQPGES